MIKIEKHYEKKILRDYFFIEGIVEINSNYFINKIKEGFKEDNNQSFKTNVRDAMTSWHYFNQDEEFLKISKCFIAYVDESIKLPKYKLLNSWGYCVSQGGRTTKHQHEPNLWSGVIYLNDHEQTLDFYEISKKIKPQKGKFALFSSFLEHESLPHYKNKKKWGISFNYALDI